MKHACANDDNEMLVFHCPWAHHAGVLHDTPATYRAALPCLLLLLAAQNVTILQWTPFY